MLYTYEHDGTTYTLNVERAGDGTYRVTLDGTPYTLRPIGGGFALETGSERRHVRAHVARESTPGGDLRHVWVDGDVFTLTVAETGAARKRGRSAAQGGALAAQMPGKINAVLVAEGDAVSAGQTLILMEAMKMELRVAAAADGTVRRVRVSVGDVVERGQVLVELG